MNDDATAASLFDPTTEHEAGEPEADEPPCSMPEGSAEERAFLLAAADTLDGLFAAWTSAGRDPEELAAELRMSVTAGCLQAQQAEEAT